MANYYYPVLGLSNELTVKFTPGNISAYTREVDISPTKNWEELKKAVKKDETALNAAITATGITDAGLISFFKQLVTLPLKNRRDIIVVLEKMNKNNVADKDRIEQGSVLMQQAFGVSCYVPSVSSGLPASFSLMAQEKNPVDIGRKFGRVEGSTFFVPEVSDDGKKFRIERKGGSYRTYYDGVNPIPVSKTDYDDFFTVLDTKYSTNPDVLGAVKELKTMYKVATPGDLPDTKKLNAYMRFIFAPSAFEKVEALKPVTGTVVPPTGGTVVPPVIRTVVPPVRTPVRTVASPTGTAATSTGTVTAPTGSAVPNHWGRSEKKPWLKRFGNFFAAHWLGSLIGAIAITGIVIGTLVLTAPASVMGLVGALAAFGTSAVLVPQLSIFLSLFAAGTLIGLRASLFRTRRQRRKAEIKAWKKHKKIENSLIKDKSTVNNRVYRLENSVTASASARNVFANVRSVNRALEKSSDNLDNMIKKLDKEKVKRIKINNHSHLPGIGNEEVLNAAQVTWETTEKMKNTLVDDMAKLEVVKKRLDDLNKKTKADKIQSAIDKMKALQAKAETENKKLYDPTNPLESETIKVPGDVISEDNRRSGRTGTSRRP